MKGGGGEGEGRGKGLLHAPQGVFSILLVFRWAVIGVRGAAPPLASWQYHNLLIHLRLLGFASCRHSIICVHTYRRHP